MASEQQQKQGQCVGQPHNQLDPVELFALESRGLPDWTGRAEWPNKLPCEMGARDNGFEPALAAIGRPQSTSMASQWMFDGIDSNLNRTPPALIQIRDLDRA